MSNRDTLYMYEALYREDGPIHSLSIEAQDKADAMEEALTRLFNPFKDEDFGATQHRLKVEVRRIYKKYKEGDLE